MWIVRKGSASYHVGYYRPDSTFITFLKTSSLSMDDMRTAMKVCHYLNGGDAPIWFDGELAGIEEEE